MTPSSTAAHIEPAVLRWARESAGYSLRQAADEIAVEKWYLELVEAGGELLTLREAERAADAYARPLAALFLPSPLDEEPQEVQFRRLPGAPEPPWGAEVQLTTRKVSERQQAALEIYDVLEERPPWLDVLERFATAPRNSLPEVAREVMGVSREDQRGWTQDPYASFRGWRAAIEGLGILVMQEGPVPVEQMRGFASIEPPEIPAIFVNNKDDPRARAFTVVHEFGHIVLSGRGEPIGEPTERWCEEFAGQVVMPTNWFAEAFHSSEATSTLGRVEDMARVFGVTPLAAAVRVSRTGLITRDEAAATIAQIQRRWKGGDENDEGGGGSYYVNQVARFGPSYLRLVFTALDTQAVTLPTASALLDGVKVKYFEPLRDRLEGRQ